MTLEESNVRTRKHLSLSEKVEIISFFNNVKCSVRKLAKYFNIGKTQAGHIVKQKDQLLELWFANGEIKNGKLRPDSIGYQIDKYVYNWYQDTKNENIPVSGPMIQNKALEIAKELGHEEFKASNGWLERFRIRHKINQKSRAGKGVLNLDQWREKLNSATSTYSPENVFSAVETGLFYRAAPEETSSLISEVLLDKNLADKKVTVLLCFSLAGTKEKPLVVVKPPSNGADCDPGRFPPNCAFNGAACLTRDIVVKWLSEFDSRMVSQNRSAALLLGDSFSAFDTKLSNVEILYVPTYLFPDGKSPSQCVVQDFKIAYRQLLLKRLLELRENDGDATRVGPSEGAALIEAAWEKVGESVVYRSFGEVGCDANAAKCAVGDTEASLDDVSNLLCAYDCDVKATDYLSVDSDLATVDVGGPEILEVLVDGDEMRDILPTSGDGRDENRNAVRDRLLPDVYDMGPEASASGTSGAAGGQFEASNVLAVNSYSEALYCLKGLEHFYLSQNDSKATVLVNQLIVQNEKTKNKQFKNATKTDDQ